MSFSSDIIQFCRLLPADVVAPIVARQLIRAATSVAANYRSACRAVSRRSFLAKLGIVEEEVDESAYWLELLIRLRLGDVEVANRLLDEAYQLLAITVASRKTARHNSQK